MNTLLVAWACLRANPLPLPTPLVTHMNVHVAADYVTYAPINVMPHPLSEELCYISPDKVVTVMGYLPKPGY